MLTFTLQCVATAVLLAMALVALRVAREPGADPHHAAAWRVTGAAFLAFACARAAQNVSGGIAMAAGAGTPTMAAYLRWLPVFNHSRTFLMVGLAAALVVLALMRGVPRRRFAALAAGLLAAGFAAGALLGLMEGGFLRPVHYGAVAVWDGLELVVLLSTLFVVLLTNRVDRYLWALLAAYACSIALGFFWFALLAQIGGWRPSPWSLNVMRVVLFVTMLAVAWMRLRAARRGRTPQGMLGPPLPSSSRLSMIR